MKAVVCTRYGPPEVLQIRDLADPVPRGSDVVIRIRATAVTPSDCFIRSGIPASPLPARAMLRLFVGFTKPRRAIPGAVLAGEIETAGKNVTRFRAGDRVWAFTLMRMSCCAERIRLAEKTRLLALAPSNLSHDEAAAIPYAGLLAGHFLAKADIRKGDRVLVYGASGANGTTAVQLAKGLGAHVTAVCSTANLDLVRSLGADEVIDYAREESPGSRRFDVVFDAAGRKKTSALKEACRKALTIGGRVVSVDDGLTWPRRDDIERLKVLVESGRLKPVIDRRYPLEQIADAHRYVELGHKKGNVIVTIGG
ncbi:MAG TPA: NAD(P)-dependent alcohol dehydrogenase [Candidatus Polarisedimenticolaceae bacterium]|nr:NAD(P)-dependent alcohol dehydrogenase [Candidatus Polarisedimenticolaceae bacterium]